MKALEAIKTRAAAIAAAHPELKNVAKAGYEAGSLPKSGVFAEAVRPSGEGDFRHLRIDCGLESLSLGTIKANAFFGTKEDIKVKASEKEGDFKGKFFLTGTAPVNPHFSRFSIAELAGLLEGEKFEATPVEGWTLPYKAEGYTEAEAINAAVQRTFYKITLVD